MPSTLYNSSITINRPAYIGSTPWQLTGLRPITVLFGKNGSGKSILLRTWRDLHPDTSHYIIPERTGDLGYNASYLQVQTSVLERTRQSIGNFTNDYRQHIIARIQAFLVTRGAIREGQLPGKIEELEGLISTLLPNFELEIIGSIPPYKLRRAQGQQEVTNVTGLSSGEAQVLTLALDILTMSAMWEIQNAQTRLMLIDEPDAHVHPDLQARFAEFLVQVSNRYDLQLVIATHSTTLLSALGQFGGLDCGVIYLDRTKAEFKAQPFTMVLRTLASCLGGHALMGPLFGVPLLLVEGDDDYRVWSQAPRHQIVSFSVIPCNGTEIDQYQKSLETIFASLCEPGNKPIGYALKDGDKSLPQPQRHSPQNYIRYMRLNCHETENLYLTDEVLYLLGTTWEVASAQIVEASPNRGKKTDKLANAPNWDRQWEDIKDVINEIAAAIDPKGVLWTQRLGVAIGSSVPKGQLAEFLGKDVISNLWDSVEQVDPINSS